MKYELVSGDPGGSLLLFNNKKNELSMVSGDPGGVLLSCDNNNINKKNNYMLMVFQVAYDYFMIII